MPPSYPNPLGDAFPLSETSDIYTPDFPDPTGASEAGLIV